MANMDYCKFNNTSIDMDNCLWAFEEGRKTSAYECEKAEYMFRRILGTMMDLGIIDDYDYELLHDYCWEMKEEESDE